MPYNPRRDIPDNVAQLIELLKTINPATEVDVDGTSHGYLSIEVYWSDEDEEAYLDNVD